jgi:hypothetical protein
MSTRVIAATITREVPVWISVQTRRVTAPIRREMKRRAAVALVIEQSRPSAVWAAIVSKGATAIASMLCWPPPDTTAAASALAEKVFVRPHPGAPRRVAGSPNHLKTADHPFFTVDDEKLMHHVRNG